MAKELPYFQFEPAEYLTKDISFCSLAAQGLFTNICSYYWQRGCKITKQQVLRRLDFPDLFDELVSEGVIDLKGDEVVIKFLNNQWDKAVKSSGKNSKNGAKGGRPKLQDKITTRFGDIIPRYPSSDDHFVYLFRNNEDGSYKIGETKDLFKRRNTIKVSSNYLEIIHFVYVDAKKALEIEKYIKDKFFDKIISGDWLSLKNDYQDVIIEMNKFNKADKKPKKSESKGNRREEKIKEEKKIDENREDELLHNIDDLFFDYLKNERLINALIENKNFPLKSKSEIENQMHDFKVHLRSNDDIMKSRKDFNSHFRNWVLKKKSSDKKEIEFTVNR